MSEKKTTIKSSFKSPPGIVLAVVGQKNRVPFT